MLVNKRGVILLRNLGFQTLLLNCFSLKSSVKTIHASPVSFDISSHSSSDSVTWEKPQSSKHHAQSSSRMKPNLLTSLPAPQPEEIKRREYIDLNSLISAHMFAPLSAIEPSYQLNLSLISQHYYSSQLLQKADYQP